MDRPCPNVIDCPGSDDPILNLSSEAVDGVSFFALRWPFCITDPFTADCIPGQPPVSPPCNGCPPPAACAGAGCGTDRGPAVECVSTESQLDADLCAQRQADTTQNQFYNQTQTCSMQCADGFTNFFVVRAGTFVSSTQELADRVAFEFACQSVARFLTCPSEIVPTLGCKDTAFIGTISVTARDIGLAVPFTITLVSGSLPPGLTLTTTGPASAIISGTPTAAGTYHFSIKFQGVDGRSSIRAYTLDIGGIIPDALPDGATGTAYSETLTALTLVAPITWTVSAGSLPTGFSLNSSTGEISCANPTIAETASFTIKATDFEGDSCEKNYGLTVTAPSSCLCVLGCPDRVEISGYVDGMFTILTVPCDPFGAGGLPVASGAPHWDGKFSSFVSPSPNCVYMSGITSIQGWEGATAVDNNSVPGFWTMVIAIQDFCTGGPGSQYVWVGQKGILPGDDPTGIYNVIPAWLGQPVVNLGIATLTLVKY